MHQVNKQIKTAAEWKWKTRDKHSQWHRQGFAEWWLFFPASYSTITPSLTNCLAILPPQAFLFLHCGQWRAKHTTLLVITVRKRDPLQFPWLWTPPPYPPKAPQGSSCNSNQSLKSSNLGLKAWVVACEEDINQAAPNKREGKREGDGESWGRKESLAASVLLFSKE